MSKKELPAYNSEEVSKYNRKKRQKPALSLKGDIKENGVMLKEEEEDIVCISLFFSVWENIMQRPIKM